MSRIKSRSQVEVCGDCGASDPSWASINRGILLCAECCSVHRSLGRHISQVKSLRQGSWIPSVLNLVNTLNANGANSVWEHGLLDPSLPKSQRSKKPSAKDPLHPNKAEFIRAKHMNLAYIPKPDLSTQDGLNPEIDLSKQLHASVRSTNIEITLRLLVQGADPNYFHEDKGSTPLHVAAKFGQPNQVELLLVYGADLFAKDAGGLIPLEVAKNNSHMEISSRLYEAQFDVTDRICYFLCNKRPDHLSGPHIIFPDQRQNGISEQLKIARGKLQLVPNKMFEELVMDIYDEVDRREMEAIWATSAMNPEIGCVPFLPTNPHLSATRNQGRQKLARFSPTEFASLLNDVLVDAKRRENMATLRPMGSMSNVIGDPSRISNLSDDEPLYDAVASDDDYAALTPVIQQSTGKDGQIVEVEQLRKRLEASFSEIHELRTMVQKLASENTELKSRMEEPKNHSHSLSMENGVAEQDEAKQKRPVSMYEARGIQHNHHNLMGDSRIANSMYQMGNHAIKEGWPTEVEVKTKTDLVTRRIQELWNAMKEPTVNDQFNTCADNIRSAVNELVALFPEVLNNEVLKSAIKQLKVNVTVIQNECSGLQFALVNDNQTARDTYMPKVLECAFNLAKATKTLVTNFEANQ